MNTEEKYDLVEKYLDGKLNGDALLDFEKQLENDEALKKEMTLHQQISETLRGEKVHELRDVLKSVNQQWQSPPVKVAAKPRRFRIGRIAAIAASVLFLFFTSQYFFSSGSQTNEALFADHFEPYQMILNQRTQNPKAPEVGASVDEAVAAYLNKDYEASSLAFQKLQNETPAAVIFKFYTAISELSLGNANKAIPILEEISVDAPPIFAEQCQWYLALAYLKNGDRIKAKNKLAEIQRGAFKYEEAQELIRQF